MRRISCLLLVIVTLMAPSRPPSPSYWQEIPEAAFKFEMMWIPGDEARAIQPFWMSRNEITWEAFDVFVYQLDLPTDATMTGADAVTRPSKPYLPPDRGFGHEGFAAISMSFKTAQQFCAWLSARTGKTYRLPTEKEWEFACLAGASGDFNCGDDAAKLGEFAWFTKNAEGVPHAVGKKKPNAWGLHDMHGNVQEWCTDADGKPVTKGGSYRDSAEKLKISARALPEPSWNASDPQIPKSPWWLADAPFVGFRIVCEVEEDVPATQPSAKEGKPQ